MTLNKINRDRKKLKRKKIKINNNKLHSSYQARKKLLAILFLKRKIHPNSKIKRMKAFKKKKAITNKKIKYNKNRVRQILSLMRPNIKINLMMSKNDSNIFILLY
jgi:hypothetical protein